MKHGMNWLGATVAITAVIGVIASSPSAKAFPGSVAKSTPVLSAPIPIAQTDAHGAAHHVQDRIAELRAKLHITAAQEPQFTALADVMTANAQSLASLLQQRVQDNDASAVASMRWYERLVEAHADALKKFVPVFDQLYTSLSDEQKKTADAVFERFGGRPRHGHRHHHRSE